eukprot:1159621-Pelagomonas_calceolata.AAC.4
MGKPLSRRRELMQTALPYMREGYIQSERQPKMPKGASHDFEAMFRGNTRKHVESNDARHGHQKGEQLL